MSLLNYGPGLDTLHRMVCQQQAAWRQEPTALQLAYIQVKPMVAVVQKAFIFSNVVKAYGACVEVDIFG